MKVPVYEPQVELSERAPDVAVEPRLLSLAPRAAAESWEQIARAGEQLVNVSADLNQKMARARRTGVLADATMDYKVGLFDLEDKIAKEHPDPNTWVQSYREMEPEIFQQIHDRLPDGQSQALFHQHRAAYFPLGLHGVMTAARTANNEIIQGSLPAFLQKSADLYIQAKTPQQRQEIRNAGLARIDAAVAAGALHPGKLEQLKANFDGMLMQKVAQHAVTYDYYGAYNALADPEKNFPGLDLNQARLLRNQAEASIRHDQDQRYQGYFQQLVEASADKPTAGMPDPAAVRRDMESGGLRPQQANSLLAYVQGSEGGPGDKAGQDRSYMEATNRLFDTKNPLSTEEIMKNVSSGAWKFKDPRTYEHFMKEAAGLGEGKSPKLVDSQIKSRLAQLKPLFHDPYMVGEEYYQIALAQMEQGREAGVFDSLVQRIKEEGGKAKLHEEVNRALDAYFQPQLQAYHTKYAQENQAFNQRPEPGTLERVWGWVHPEGKARAGGGAGAEREDIRNDLGWMKRDLRGTGKAGGGAPPLQEPPPINADGKAKAGKEEKIEPDTGGTPMLPKKGRRRFSILEQ